MLTPIGKYLRKMRIDLDESMDDMSARLGVSKTYLSFIENGTREIRQDFAAKIMDEYNIGGEQAAAFLKAFYETPVKTITLETEKVSHLRGAESLASQFVIALPKMNQTQLDKFSELFNQFIAENNIEGVIGDLS